MKIMKVVLNGTKEGSVEKFNEYFAPGNYNNENIMFSKNDVVFIKWTSPTNCWILNQKLILESKLECFLGFLYEKDFVILETYNSIDEIHDKNIHPYKVGDEVKCIDKGRKGYGWTIDKVFKIKSIDQLGNGGLILWNDNGGVYSESVEMYKQTNSTTFKARLKGTKAKDTIDFTIYFGNRYKAGDIVTLKNVPAGNDYNRFFIQTDNRSIPGVLGREDFDMVEEFGDYTDFSFSGSYPPTKEDNEKWEQLRKSYEGKLFTFQTEGVNKLLNIKTEEIKMEQPKTNLEKTACKQAKEEVIKNAVEAKAQEYRRVMADYINAEKSARDYRARADELATKLNITEEEKKQLF